MHDPDVCVQSQSSHKRQIFHQRQKKKNTVWWTISALSRNESGRYRCFMEKPSGNPTRECLTQISLTESSKHESFSLKLTDKFAKKYVEPTFFVPKCFGRYFNFCSPPVIFFRTHVAERDVKTSKPAQESGNTTKSDS